MAEPGLTPRSPVSVVDPVLVTVVPARTAKLCAEPRDGAVAASAGYTLANRTAPAATPTREARSIQVRCEVMAASLRRPAEDLVGHVARPAGAWGACATLRSRLSIVMT